MTSRMIFDHAARAKSRAAFLEKTAKTMLELSGCDTAGVWLKEGDKIHRCEFSPQAPEPFSLHTEPRAGAGKTSPSSRKSDRLGKLCLDVLAGRIDRSLPGFTPGGAFWTGDATENPLPAASRARSGKNRARAQARTIAVIPVEAGGENIGLLILKSHRAGLLDREDIEFLETAAQTLGFAWSARQTQAALQERVKELTCLYEIAQLSGEESASLDVIFQGAVESLPLAWQRPEIAQGRIVFDGRVYQTPTFADGPGKLSSEIVVNGQRRGAVEIVYAGDKTAPDDDLFLQEERNLLDAVAAQLALIIQRKQAEEERGRLSDQLRHADRLATIGQLAAGVAHELNEPLGSILGFAQILKKTPGLAGQAEQDLDKIVKSSLHAREIIKKLMLFGRQTPLQKARVNLNQLVEEGLYFIESRAVKEGIQLIKRLDPALPEITADLSQLNQVLVNLVVNAIQAMPRGGELTIRTDKRANHVRLVVEDTGTGMSEEQVQKLFIPFYTTKEIGEGTGLGLPVVHGIVTSHRGEIRVRSKPGKGSRFEIRLPQK